MRIVCFGAIFIWMNSASVAQENDQEKNDLLSHSPFEKEVVFENPKTGSAERRKFHQAQSDAEHNVVFESNDNPILIIARSRIRGVAPLPPATEDPYSLEELEAGLVQAKTAAGRTPEFHPLVKKWEEAVEKKRRSLALSEIKRKKEQEERIQAAAIETAAEELAKLTQKIENYDQVGARGEMQEGLDSIARIRPELLPEKSKVEQAIKYWSFILGLPVAMPIPKSWPADYAAEQFILISEPVGHSFISYATLSLFSIFGVVGLASLSRLLSAFRQREILSVLVPLICSCLAFVGLWCLFFMQPLVSEFPRKESIEALAGKTSWENGKVVAARLFRKQGEISLAIRISLGSAFFAIPAEFVFRPGLSKTPGAMQVDHAYFGSIPVPNDLAQQLWTFLSARFSWVS